MPKATMAMSSDFLGAFARLPSSQQRSVRTLITRFNADSTAGGLNYERVQGARDRKLRSLRIDGSYRAIISKPERGNVHILLWADKHDEAYEWARRHRCDINPETGAIQVYEPDSGAPAEPHSTPDEQSADAGQSERLDDEFEVREPAVPRPEGPATHAARDAHRHAPGGTRGPGRCGAGRHAGAVARRGLRGALPLSSRRDLRTARRRPRSPRAGGYRRLRVCSGPSGIARTLLRRRGRSGPRSDAQCSAGTLARVSSSNSAPPRGTSLERTRCGYWAVRGTGKTVAAMHRARWLARNLSDGRILFTTFARNLATDIENNLRAICSPDEMSRIEVTNLDRWVVRFLRGKRYEFQVQFGRNQEAWQRALDLKPSELDLSDAFFEDEWGAGHPGEGSGQRAGIPACIPRRARHASGSRCPCQGLAGVRGSTAHSSPSAVLKEVDDAYRDAAALLRG